MAAVESSSEEGDGNLLPPGQGTGSPVPEDQLSPPSSVLPARLENTHHPWLCSSPPYSSTWTPAAAAEDYLWVGAKGRCQGAIGSGRALQHFCSTSTSAASVAPALGTKGLGSRSLRERTSVSHG